MKRMLAFCLAGVALLIASSFQTFAQTREYDLKGVVKDVLGEPIAGASIVEDGTRNGITTDVDGKFALRVSSKDALVTVSFIGFKTVQLVASSSRFISGIVLEEDKEVLEDAVVIGYGTVKKNDLTGSVTAIKAEEINRGAVSSSYELLQGKIPGLLVQPGGRIRIRGTSSLNASNNPLIVVDGVPLQYNDLSSINSDDIESFSVLKDASSAAIYGSRAAGGVILVTTKKADMKNKVSVNYSGSYSISHYMGKQDVMSADEFRSFIGEIYADRPASLALAQSLMGDQSTDWIDLVTRLGQTVTNNVGISGTVLNGHLPYRASISDVHYLGTTLGSSSESPNVNITLNPTFLHNHLNISINGKAATRISSQQSASYSSAATFNPTLPVYFTNADGSVDTSTNLGYWVRGTGTGSDFVPASNAESNPMQYQNEDFNYRNWNYVLSGIVNYKVQGFEDLSLNLNLSTDGYSYDNWYRTKAGYWGLVNDSVAPKVGTNTTNAGRSYNDMLEFYGNYQHDFNGHNISLMAGYSWEHFYDYTYTETRLNGDYDNDVSDIHYKKGDLYGNAVPNATEHFLVSFYGRFNYSYKSRYLFTFTLRDDGSSRFAPENRWGLFPSLAVAWNIKNEEFMKDLDALSGLKFRLGWGITGQESGIANYSYLANYTMSTSTSYMYNMGADGLSYMLTPSAYDPNIKWEETATLNAGVDFELYKGVVSGNIDVYQKNTKDLLNSVTIPLGANFSNKLLTNIGSIVNKGVEVGLSVMPISNRDMSLVLGLNGTYQNTKFTKLTVGNSSANENYYIQVGTITGGTGGYLQQDRVGYAPNVFYCYQQVYDSDGNPIQNAFVDRDGDGSITENDRYLTGKKPMPDFYYGVNLKFRYKNWDFGFNGHGSEGNWMFYDYYQSHSTSANDNLNYSLLYNYPEIVRKTGWTATSNTAQGYSDYWLYDASFFKIDDVNIGYTFKKMFNTNATARLALTANNVLVITKYPGVDPEGSYASVTANGIDSDCAPKIRTYTLRLNINF